MPRTQTTFDFGMKVREGGGLEVDYYVPDFYVEVEGLELTAEDRADILDIKVVMEKDNLTSFDLTLNNWDDVNWTVKHSDSEKLTLGNQVHVRLGYVDRLVSMVHGRITSLSPKFTESAAPTLSVSGTDSLVLLKERKPAGSDQKKFVNKTDVEIAREVATRNHLEFKTSGEPPLRHDLVIQKNQDDAAFLMERAKRIDFECYIQADPDNGKETLYFLPPTDGRGTEEIRVFRFAWGRSLVNFAPTIRIENQVSKVTVRGWDPRNKRKIEVTATNDDLPPSLRKSGATGPAAADAKFSGRQDIVVDCPVMSEKEAREFAVSLLRERASQFNTGSGQVIGIPEMRPGDSVELEGLGDRFNGQYYVKKVEHTLGSSGYGTRFDVERMASGKD